MENKRAVTKSINSQGIHQILSPFPQIKSTQKQRQQRQYKIAGEKEVDTKRAQANENGEKLLNFNYYVLNDGIRWAQVCACGYTKIGKRISVRTNERNEKLMCFHCKRVCVFPFTPRISSVKKGGKPHYFDYNFYLISK